jgi:DNA-directed RNA polymerase subunit RPC12/RpoP
MKCPGQDMQYWNEEAIFEVKCPECSKMVEFYKDDTTRKCHSCGHRFVNPKMDFGCATYCQFAEQCLGTLPEEFVLQQDNLLKDKVAVEMKRFFKSDFKSISHATKVARYAERIGKATEGANLALILCSAYLLNIGYSEAAQQNSVVSSVDLRREGPAIASTILQKLGANEGLIAHVSNIIGHSQPDSSTDNLAFNIVMDANQITLLEAKHKKSPFDMSQLEECLQSFLSEKGKEEARALFDLIGVQ